MTSNPFARSTSSPGNGTIHLALLPPSKTSLQQLSFQYPLKLIAPSPTYLPDDPAQLIHTVFLLTYGGGLVGGDAVDLHVRLDPTSRLVLLTQGSTKVFKSDHVGILTKQSMTVDIGRGAVLCYLPDPVQPFADCSFEQRQTYRLCAKDASLCVLDWVSQGRTARGECWDFWKYGSKNEILRAFPDQPQVLLARDNLILDNASRDVKERMHGLGVFGTLILGGPLLHKLGHYFLSEFKLLPRIGSRQWGDEDTEKPTQEETRRTKRIAIEQEDGLLWTAAATRGFIVVKFGAREIEGGKRWLMTMLSTEGSIEKLFGERALLCLR